MWHDSVDNEKKKQLLFDLKASFQREKTHMLSCKNQWCRVKKTNG